MPEVDPDRLTIKSPDSDAEWAAYYELRWRILRAPWKQPRGSERDEFDAASEHRCVLDKNNKIIAIGRLHFIDDQISLIRYMAVKDSFQRQGLGKLILQSLEVAAQHASSGYIQLVYPG